jgi:hypothetical protein
MALNGCTLHAVAHRLTKIPGSYEFLEQLHLVLYKRRGTASSRKKDTRAFSGWTFAGDSKVPACIPPPLLCLRCCAGRRPARGCRLPSSAARAAQPRPQLQHVHRPLLQVREQVAAPTQRSSCCSCRGVRAGAGRAGQDRGAAGQVEAAGRAPRNGPGGPAARLGRQGANLCHAPPAVSRQQPGYVCVPLDEQLTC